MRRSRFLRRAVLLITAPTSMVAVVLALVLMGALALRIADKPRYVHLTVAPSDNADSKFADALGRELPKSFWSGKVALEQAPSLAEVADLVDDGKAQLAIVRTDVAMPKNAGTMLIVHRDAALFVATADSKITEIAGLEGKKIGIVPDDAPNNALLDTILTQNGIDTDKITRVPLKPAAVADAVAKKTIDAVMAVGPLGSEELAATVAAMGPGDEQPVILPVKNAEALEQGLFGLIKVDVPSGLFPGSPPVPEEEVETVAVDYQLVARLDMSEGAVDQLTRTIFQLRRALATTAPIANFMEGADATKGARYPLHTGATSYYQDTEKSFMDRYGDWFYILAMVGGGVGSAVASLIGSLQARTRRQSMVIIDQLEALREEAAGSADGNALRAVDKRITTVTLAALHRAREGRIDQAGLEVLRIAAEEARRAVDQRAAELSAKEPEAPRAIRAV